MRDQVTTIKNLTKLKFDEDNLLAYISERFEDWYGPNEPMDDVDVYMIAVYEHLMDSDKLEVYVHYNATDVGLIEADKKEFLEYCE